MKMGISEKENTLNSEPDHLSRMVDKISIHNEPRNKIKRNPSRRDNKYSQFNNNNTNNSNHRQSRSTNSDGNHSNYAPKKKYDYEKISNSSHSTEEFKEIQAKPQEILSSNPFIFAITHRDMQVCEETANSIGEMYNSITLEPEIENIFQVVYYNVENYLYLQRKNIDDFYEQKRSHDIDMWLKSSSEEEQKRYFERSKKY